MDTLFSQQNQHQPLAARVRPRALEEVIGQPRLVGPDGLISMMFDAQKPHSIFLWGPPGTGKTTIARIIHQFFHAYPHVELSALSSGVKEVREIISEARDRIAHGAKPTILFIDEIHRFNKAQQEQLLAGVEEGNIILLGATTENPSFHIVPALRSRIPVGITRRLDENALQSVLERALENIYKQQKYTPVFDQQAIQQLIHYAGGDARKMLTHLERVLAQHEPKSEATITIPDIEQTVGELSSSMGSKSDRRYATISAFIKSLRGSDVDAALFYAAALINGGEDPLYLFRRMIIFASEDIGNAAPQALQIAVSGHNAFKILGMPEGRITLGQVITYLATAPKSNASYVAIKKALRYSKEHQTPQIPKHIINGETRFMKDLGFGQDYIYPHSHPDSDQDYWPENIQRISFYEPDNTPTV